MGRRFGTDSVPQASRAGKGGLTWGFGRAGVEGVFPTVRSVSHSVGSGPSVPAGTATRLRDIHHHAAPTAAKAGSKNHG